MGPATSARSRDHVIRFHVVGIVRRPLDLSDRATSGGLLELSRAFADKYDGQVGVFGTSLRVRASGDSHDVSKVIRAARQVFGQSVVNAQGLTVETEGARDAIHVLTLALWIVAAVIAIAGAITIGLVLDREIALLDVDGSTLRTIGVTRVQRIATAAPLALLVASEAALPRGDRPRSACPPCSRPASRAPCGSRRRASTPTGRCWRSASSRCSRSCSGSRW